SDRQLRAALLRLVDVAPACRSVDDLAAHLVGFLGGVERSVSLELAMRMGASRAGRAALGSAAAAGVRHMARRFIVAETPREAEPVIAALWREGVGTSVDLLGEATVRAPEAERYGDGCGGALGAGARV